MGTADSGAAQGGHWPPLVARRRTRPFPRAEAWARSQAHSKLRSPSSLASATGLAPPRVVGTVSCRRLQTLVASGAARDPRTVGTQGRPRNSDPPSPASRLCEAIWGRALSARSSFSCCSSPALELSRSVSPQPVLGSRFRGGSTEARACHVPLLRWSWDLEQSLGLGFG